MGTLTYATAFRLAQIADALADASSAALPGPLMSAPMAHGALNGTALLEPILSAMKDLPRKERGVSRPFLDLRIALVGGDALIPAFESLATVDALKHDDWRDQLRTGRPDLLLIIPPERAGIDSWSLNRPDGASRSLLQDELIPRAKGENIPIVYWGLHDSERVSPWHISIAALADHVLSATEEALPQYQAACSGVASFGTLTAGVSPSIHTPIGSRPALSSAVLLDGQWGAETSAEPSQYLQWALDGVMTASRALLVTNSGHDQSEEFAREFGPYFAEIGDANISDLMRGLDVTLIKNEVIASQTAFSPRALEAMACGTLVLGTYNQGINSHYPQVHVANSPGDVRRMLESMTLEELRHAQASGIRQVFTENHLHTRLMTLGTLIGKYPDIRPERVLGVTFESSEALMTDMSQQTHSRVEVVAWDELSRAGSYDILLPLSPQRRYSPTYVADHVAAFAYQGCDITTKLEGSAESSDDHAHRRTDELSALDLTAWWRPSPVDAQSPETLIRAASGRPAYSIDHLGHSRRREATVDDPNHQTATGFAHPRPGAEAGDSFEEVYEEVGKTAAQLGLELTVIVPVYNNGTHLRHKCFASLRRSSAFEKMHILLINDGSTDPATVDTIEELSAAFPNVTSFHHAKGGSGSASRPRNTGLDLAQTQFVTYLDPDNEATEDGFAVLLEDIKQHSEVDFCIGNISVWQRKFAGQKYYQRLVAAFADDIDASGTIHLPERAITRIGFRPISIQAAVIRSSWLKSLGIRQPLGAVGQDTFFFQQMFHYAKQIRPFDIHVHTYYSAVANSTVNSVSPRFFKKYLPLERARSEWLREVALLEDYREERLEYFLKTWHLAKMTKVSPEEWLEAAGVVEELTAYYGPMEWKSAKVRSFFAELTARRAAGATTDAVCTDSPARSLSPGTAAPPEARVDELGDHQAGLRYSRGFVILPVGAAVPASVAHWSRFPIPGHVLHVDPRVPVEQATGREREVWLVGDAFDPENARFVNLASVLAEGDLLAHLDRIAGRFVLIVRHKGGRMEVYHDAMGSRSVFHGVGVVASHASLAAEQIGAGFRDWLIPFLTSRGYIKRDVKFLPGLYSPFEGVEQLTPNTRLVLPSGSVERYWPRDPLQRTTDDHAVDMLVSHVRGLSGYLSATAQRPVIGLSAGRDSRCMFGALAGLSPSLFTFVRGASGSSMSSEDSRIALRLAETVGLGIEVIKLEVPPHLNSASTEFAKQFRRNTAHIRGNTSGWIEHLWEADARRDSQIFIRGFGGEVMRGFHRLASTAPEALSATYNVNAGSVYTRDAFRHFREVVAFDESNFFGCPISDMFYWEHRMGVWGSSSFSEADMALRGIPAYNSRNLFTAFWGLDSGTRADGAHFKRAAAILSPALAAVPYAS